MPAELAGAGAGAGATAGAGAPHGLVIGESDVFDQAEYDAYRLLGGPSVALHGGAALFSGPRVEVLEGSRPWRRLVGLVFESMGAARTWHDSPEHQQAREQRLRGARSSVWLIEQTGDPAPIAPGSGAAPLAYMLGEVTAIHDTEHFKEYLRSVAPSLATVGGRYLTKGGRIDLVEGPWQPARAVLIEFPSWDVAAAWYRSDAYQPLARLRQGCADTELVLLEGVMRA
jgi:uncharacterized protein (DUF1330 family)